MKFIPPTRVELADRIHQQESNTRKPKSRATHIAFDLSNVYRPVEDEFNRCIHREVRKLQKDYP